MKKIPIWRLRKLVTYHSETGFLSRIGLASGVVNRANLGHLEDDGYRRVCIEGVRFPAHHIAYAMHYGFYCESNIDHINGNRDDNRITNLRPTTKRENQQNRQSHRDGRLVGTTFDVVRGKWVAQIEIDGRNRKIGRFNSEREAHEAYMRRVVNGTDCAAKIAAYADKFEAALKP